MICPACGFGQKKQKERYLNEKAEAPSRIDKPIKNIARYLRPEDDGTEYCLCLCHSPTEVDWPAYNLIHPRHCSACDGGRFVARET